MVFTTGREVARGGDPFLGSSRSYHQEGQGDKLALVLNPNSELQASDHSASLVGIADQLGDSPFGVVHRRLAPAFSIVVLWVIGRHGTTSQNFSAM
ncbi:hypothetical protein MTR67_030423 [Solanum verrucosum]|uniref:Uncharacterized protein n=1 Tax=Solanum verrucosum TaxID=315347 RepID=A0AAF0RAH0_SOLVR|nr:hypothetical protein MTR67_030423 [Solanum verrucosum]